jgi:phosphoenolpyruvate synthase/pyruvate phosphate dikinase
MTFGYSRDDIASFLPVYLEKKILNVDPFQVLDQTGVGQLVEMAVKKGRGTRPHRRVAHHRWQADVATTHDGGVHTLRSHDCENMALEVVGLQETLTIAEALK